jgi:hypothetical protein
MPRLARLVFLDAVFRIGSVRHLETLLSTELDSDATKDLSASSTRTGADRRCVLGLGAASVVTQNFVGPPRQVISETAVRGNPRQPFLRLLRMEFAPQSFHYRLAIYFLQCAGAFSRHRHTDSREQEGIVLKQFLICAVAVTGFFDEAAEARCIGPPPQVRAQVTVGSCVAATFGSSHIQMAFPPKGLIPLYKLDASYSGVILVVEVKTSELATQSNDPDDVAYLREWAAGLRKELFVRGSIDEVCPPAVYGTITVTTDDGWLCCDRLPWEGRCLIPSTAQIATVNKGRVR